MIKLHSPIISKSDQHCALKAIESGWLSSAGKYVSLFENQISKINKSKFACSIINGTAALNICLKLIGLTNSDEVIVPTVTFIAPVNAVLYHGAKPIFMDCDNYLNIDTSKIIKFLDKETFYKKKRYVQINE